MRKIFLALIPILAFAACGNSDTKPGHHHDEEDAAKTQVQVITDWQSDGDESASSFREVRINGVRCLEDKHSYRTRALSCDFERATG